MGIIKKEVWSVFVIGDCPSTWGASKKGGMINEINKVVFGGCSSTRVDNDVRVLR